VLKALSDDIVFSNIPFVGKADVIRVYVNVPAPDNYSLVISAPLPRAGIIEILKEQRY